MKIGLYNLEPKIVNSAMMRVSSYHKKRGDQVERYGVLKHDEYNMIYAFSIFNFTPKPFIRIDMIKGGSGFDIKKKLPKEIDECYYDWSLYPDCDFSLIWFSEGCIRNCPFCIVRQKEGYIHPVTPRNLNPNGKYIKVMDNNFFANPKWRSAVLQLLEWGQLVDFQGVDVRLINKEQANALNSIKHHKRIKIAWDNPKEDILKHIKRMLKWVKPYKIMCYVLIGYWSTPKEDLYRVEKLRDLGIDPYIMPFDKHDRYQKDFTRWVNHKAIFNTVSWKDYDRGVKK